MIGFGLLWLGTQSFWRGTILSDSPSPIHDHKGSEARTTKEEKKDKPTESFWKRTTEDPTAFFTLWLAFFTAGLTVSTVALWWATKKAAERQVRDTEILQRAYISVAPAGVTSSNDPSKCHPNIIIRNAGNLPAKNVSWFMEWRTSLDDRLKTFKLDVDKLEGEVTLTAGTSMRQGGPIIYIGNDVGDLKSQRGLYLYVWGMVRYEDGFGESRRTLFCHRYNTVNLREEDRQSIRGFIFIPDDARIHRFGNDAT